MRTASGALQLSEDSLSVGWEVLNPLHSRLLSDTLSSRLAIADLESERHILTESLTDLRTELIEVRNQRLDAQRDRSVLELALDEASSAYSARTSRSQQLQLAATRPEAAEMIIREGGGALEGLRTRIREVERVVATMNAQIEQVTANRIELQGMVNTLRDRIATMGLEQSPEPRGRPAPAGTRHRCPHAAHG